MPGLVRLCGDSVHVAVRRGDMFEDTQPAARDEIAPSVLGDDALRTRELFAEPVRIDKGGFVSSADCNERRCCHGGEVG